MNLQKSIIPHFEKFPLQTSKQLDFERLKEVCHSMNSQLHCSREGLQSIINTAYAMNNLGARRQEKSMLLTIVSKMKV